MQATSDEDFYREIATDGAQCVMRFYMHYQGPQITPVVL